MDIELSAQVKSTHGKEAARKLRREEKVPAVLYGPKSQPVSLTVSSRQLERILRDLAGESKLLKLNIEGVSENATRQVLIRDVNVHPVRRQFLHVDFYEVPLDKKIVVEVPIELEGECVGVKKGGTLNLIHRMISVKCLPAEIPERVIANVSNLDWNDTLNLGQIAEKSPYELVGDRKLAVINIVPPEGAKGEGGE